MQRSLPATTTMSSADYLDCMQENSNGSPNQYKAPHKNIHVFDKANKGASAFLGGVHQRRNKNSKSISHWGLKPILKLDHDDDKKNPRDNNSKAIKKREYFLSLSAGTCFTAVFSWALAGHLDGSLLHSAAYTWTGVGLAILTGIVSLLLMFFITSQLRKSKEAIKTKVSKYNIAGLFFGVVGCGELTSSLLFSDVLSYVAPLCFMIATALMFKGRQLRHSSSPCKQHTTSFGTVFIGFQFLGAFSLFSGGLVEAGYLNKWMDSQSKAILGWVIVGALCLGVIGALGMTAKDTYNANRDKVIQLPICIK